MTTDRDDDIWGDGFDLAALDREVEVEAAAELLEDARRGTTPLYHVTWASRLARIRREGLAVGGAVRGNRWIGGAETRDRCRGRVFLTSADRIDYWATQMAEQLTPPRRGDSLVLLEIDATGFALTLDEEYPGDLIVSHAVDPTRILAVLEDDPWLNHVDAWLNAREQARRAEQARRRRLARSSASATPSARGARRR